MVGAVIQARLGSTRLPGKVLMDVQGKPLLLRITERLEASAEIEKIVVATSDGPQDQPIEDFCRDYGIACFRGSENDVLSRFIGAAEAYGLDDVVRVCADSPLLDTASIDAMIRLQRKKQADLVTIDPAKTSLLDGFEVTHRDFLKKLAALASNDFHREHVTYLAKENPALGKLVFYEPPKDLCHTDIRITVDTPEDLEFIRAVYQWFETLGSHIDVRKIDKLPFHLFRINQNIRQKPANKKTIKVKILTNTEDEPLQEMCSALQNLSYFQVELLPDANQAVDENALYLKRVF